MNTPVIIAVVAAVLLAGGALLLWLEGRRMEGHSRINERLDAWASMRPAEPERVAGARAGTTQIAWLAPLLLRGGITFTEKLQVILIAIPLVLLPLLGISLGAWAAGVFVLLYPLVLYGALRWKIRHFARAVVAQLPPYLDAITRSIAVGNSMPTALKLSLEQAIEPIPQIFRQVVQRQELGVSIEGALEQVAAVYQIRELTLLSAAVTVNSRYGGKMEAVLSNISNAIREYDRTQRELIAMTAETRLSAWILAALPILIGMMMSASNPKYLRGMWLDETGRWILIGAFVLDFAGTFILLRMARI